MTSGHSSPAPEMMTLPETAAFLRCHTSTLIRMVNKGKIPGFKIGSDWRFQRSLIVKWSEEHHG